MKNGYALVKEGTRRPSTVSKHRTRSAADKAFDTNAFKFRAENPGQQHPFQLRKLVGGLLSDEV